MEIADINLGKSGEILPPKSDQVALIDADTLVFGAAVSAQVREDVLPREWYSDIEWMEIEENPGFDPETNSITSLNMNLAMMNAKEKLEQILSRTGCDEFELHFTGPGKNSFRYTIVDREYKANRREYISPIGLTMLKLEFYKLYPDKVIINRCFEADDTVVAKAASDLDKYIICAVDKDVLYSLEGRHFNYYTSAKYNIDMKWIEVDKETAMKHHYKQVLMGDAGDNIIGLRGIGPRKADAILAECTTPEECQEAVKQAYEDAGRSIMDFLVNMRLVSMNQAEYFPDTDEYKLKLWGSKSYVEC